MKIFLSAVSRQFEECRKALASDLRAIGCQVRVQEDFRQGPATLIERLEEYVRGCDRVIALVGDAYGFEAATPGIERRLSYTQWEYLFAQGERLSGEAASAKELLVYFASDAYLREHSVSQASVDAERQRAFVQQIKESGKHWSQFDTTDQLCRWVLRDGWKMAARPRKVRNLPYASLGALFTGRERDMAELPDRFERDARRVVILHGLGGVGKTRLSIEYALAHEAEHSAILYVMSDSPSALRSGLAGLCAAGVLDLPERTTKDEETQVAAALKWLQDRERWLLLLDNVDTTEAAAAVEALLPKLGRGQVIVASRVSNWSAVGQVAEVQELSPEEGRTFLLERTRGARPERATDATDALELARAVEGLPLALEQASAFIQKKRVSLTEYLERWREHEESVRNWAGDPRLMQYPRGLAITWDTTFDQLDDGAQALLRLLCWFAPAPIPRAMLQTKAAGAALERLVSNGAASDVEDALATLAAFSLVRWEQSNEAVRVHRLVQEITRGRLPSETHSRWLEAVLLLFTEHPRRNPPPWDVRSWPQWEPARPHLLAVLALADRKGIAQPTGDLMGWLGMFLFAKCNWAEAEPLLRRALSIDEASYGPDHPRIAIDLNNLAALLQATNRHAEAEPLMRSALFIDEASHGPDHPRVATGLNNLAMLLQETNRLTEAEPLIRRALSIDEASYGPDHSDVATDLNNLAHLLQDTNRYAEAEPLLRRALSIDEATYGPDHPHVARDLNNLAALLRTTNRHAEAEPLMRRALSIDEASYGPDHPSVANRLNNLALLLQDTNRYADAEPLMRRALSIDEATYGPDHPDIAIDLTNFAEMLRATNQLAEAEPLMRKALSIDEASYGPDHPRVATDLNNLAALLLTTNRHAEAEPLMRRALSIDEASYGPNHPRVATRLNNLAQLLMTTNRYAEAEPLVRRALSIDEAGNGRA